MRISDWSSDVCSSDLNASLAVQVHEAQKAVDRLLKQYVQIQANPDAFEGQSIKLSLEQDNTDPQASVLALQTSPHLEALIDRKSVGSGKSVSVRVDIGGGRIIQTKINKQQ